VNNQNILITKIVALKKYFEIILLYLERAEMNPYLIDNENVNLKMPGPRSTKNFLII
jgi:hypothetical protein